MTTSSLAIEFDRYTSDGPSYSGPVRFELAGSELHQTYRAGPVEEERMTHDVRQVLPVVAAAYSAMKGDPALNSLLERLPDSYWSPINGDVNLLDLDRVRMLEFEDGQKGAIVLGGEACYFVLIVGPQSLEFAEGILHDREVYASAFPLPQTTEVQRMRP